MNGKWYMTVAIAALAVASLAAAVVLQLCNSDATHAWQAFAGLIVFFGGVHVPSPTSSGK